MLLFLSRISKFFSQHLYRNTNRILRRAGSVQTFQLHHKTRHIVRAIRHGIEDRQFHGQCCVLNRLHGGTSAFDQKPRHLPLNPPPPSPPKKGRQRMRGKGDKGWRVASRFSRFPMQLEGKARAPLDPLHPCQNLQG